MQYKDYTGDPLVEFDVLLALANNLELHEESMPGPDLQSSETGQLFTAST